jgi:hypothetical protein
MGFRIVFLKWVATMLHTSNTKVVVNEVPRGRIQHVCDLRQGDPTSPMLYVIGMEVLTKVVMAAADVGLFQSLVGISPVKRLCVYADDVVCFFRPIREEAHVVKDILRIFGKASGLHVNYRKTNATLIRANDQDEEIIRETLRCDLASFPIRYLGLQLALRPLTKA